MHHLLAVLCTSCTGGFFGGSVCDGVESSAADEVANGDVPGSLFLLGSGEFSAPSGAGDGGFGDAGEFGCFG